MKQYSYEDYKSLRDHADILSKDKFGDKVLRLENGSILKLFRVKHLFSSARIVPYSVRFLKNAEKLARINIPTVKVLDIFKIPSIERFAVLYQPLKGTTLRGYLKRNLITQDTARQLAKFIAYLHNKGVLFRSIHFANILVLPNQRFGLIDVSDMKVKKKTLSYKKRVRNFYHFTRYDMDQHLLAPELTTFIHTYTQASQLSRRQTKKIAIKIDDMYNPKKMNRSTRIAFFLYNLLWEIIAPLLRLNHRLAQGFDQRSLKLNMLQSADIWIQAASAGESYLACELLKHLKPDRPVKLFITSNTKQGLEILGRTIKEISSYRNHLSVTTAYFPFDSPRLMKKAIRTVTPKMIVLLESEIWPGFLYEAKKFGCSVCIINGRITEKSLKRYQIWHSLWKTLKPEKILAISKADARRFKKLFKLDTVDVMPNIKFDRIDFSETEPRMEIPLSDLIRPDNPFIVFGSVRKEEEKEIEKIIHKLLNEQPQIVIGLFPRHLTRIKYWEKMLNKHHLSWMLRSQITKPVSNGTLILWDTFGELIEAYKRATAVFVGGSLAPLGGQNFLEPLMNGISPVIGPFWDNFSWVGSEIMHQNLVRTADNWEEVATILISDITHPSSKADTIRKARRYLSDHQGGTAQATNLINDYFN